MVTEDVTANAVKNAMALEKEGMMSCGGGWNLYSEKKKKRLGCILCAQNLFLWEEWCDVFYAAIARLRLSLYACGFLPYFCEWIERKLQDCILERNTEVDCMQCTWAWRVLNVRKPHAVFLVSLTLISVIQSNCTRMIHSSQHPLNQIIIWAWRYAILERRRRKDSCNHFLCTVSRWYISSAIHSSQHPLNQKKMFGAWRYDR